MKEEHKQKRRDGVLKFYNEHGRKGTICKNGYVAVCVERKRKYLHRKVWEDFYGEIPKGFTIHHKDGNKLNNDITNLVLISNVEHSRMHARINKLGHNRKGVSPTNKTSISLQKQIRELRLKGYKLKDIQKITKLSYPSVQKYAKGGLLYESNTN
jgi:hypothetical protein